ncbi:lactate utilization protein C [Cytobacillus suaedae]|nr:lactate utilization protein C [Cytobacillus suaedae]
MTKGTILNRSSFLNKIANELGRETRTSGVSRPTWKFQPQWEVYRGFSQEQLVEVLKKQCKNIHTDFVQTSRSELSTALSLVVENYGGGPIVTWNDPRFQEYGLTNLLKDEWPSKAYDIHVWNPDLGEENIQKAERANVGITFSDQTLAESGTVVLYSSKDKGRSVSLLPSTYIALIPKSSIVPRITQVSHEIHNRIQNGEHIASCVNFISGPSNSADIEMNLVVGVHGPIKATYIVIEDM